MTTINNQLTEILTTQIQLAEALLVLIKQQQQAIIHSDEDEVLRLVNRQQELLQPLSALEKERISFQKSRVEIEDSAIYTLEKTLRNIIGEVVEINNQNRVLIENSLRFVRQTLRILTNDYQRNLIDTRA